MLLNQIYILLIRPPFLKELCNIMEENQLLLIIQSIVISLFIPIAKRIIIWLPVVYLAIKKSQ